MNRTLFNVISLFKSTKKDFNDFTISGISCCCYIKSYSIVSSILSLIGSFGHDVQQTDLHSYALTYGVIRLINKLSSEHSCKQSLIASRNQYHTSEQDENFQNFVRLCETMFVPQPDNFLESDYFNDTKEY